MEQTELDAALDVLNEHQDELSAWELNFAQSIETRVQAGEQLSERQEKKLCQIADKLAK